MATGRLLSTRNALPGLHHCYSRILICSMQSRSFAVAAHAPGGRCRCYVFIARRSQGEAGKAKDGRRETPTIRGGDYSDNPADLSSSPPVLGVALSVFLGADPSVWTDAKDPGGGDPVRAACRLILYRDDQHQGARMRGAKGHRAGDCRMHVDEAEEGRATSGP